MPLQEGEQTTAVVFEMERFEWATADRIELAGVWHGVRGRRFIRPTLVLEGEGESKRLLASLEHKPWPADEGGAWIAAFDAPGGPVKFASAALNVASGIDLELPPPRLRPGKPRRFPRRIEAYDATRAEMPDLLKSPGIVTEPIPVEEPRSEPVTAAAPVADPPPVEEPPVEEPPVEEPPVTDPPVKQRAGDAEAAATIDALRARLDEAQQQVRSLRADLETARQERERALADARAEGRSSATALLAEGANLRAAVERQRQGAVEARDDALAARSAAFEQRDRALLERDEAVRARKHAERDRDRAHEERDRALRKADQAEVRRRDAIEQRDAANQERDTILNLHDRGLPVREAQPRFLPDRPGPRSDVEVWAPRAVACTILGLFALIVLRIIGAL